MRGTSEVAKGWQRLAIILSMDAAPAFAPMVGLPPTTLILRHACRRLILASGPLDGTPMWFHHLAYREPVDIQCALAPAARGSKLKSLEEWLRVVGADDQASEVWRAHLRRLVDAWDEPDGTRQPPFGAVEDLDVRRIIRRWLYDGDLLYREIERTRWTVLSEWDHLLGADSEFFSDHPGFLWIWSYGNQWQTVSILQTLRRKLGARVRELENFARVHLPGGM